MTDLTKAAREALEALEKYRDMMFMEAGCRWGKGDDVIATLRAALSEAPGEEREGWVMVPVEPTEAMIHAAHDALESYPLEGNIRKHYRAMLAARPSAPTVALTEEQRAVLLFLDGWESLDGVWFGDPHPTQQGAFWWRRHLVQAFPWLTKGKEGGA